MGSTTPARWSGSHSTPTSTRSASCTPAADSASCPSPSRVWGGINNKGEIAGSYSDANFISYSFLLAGGSLIPLDPPGAVNGSAANGVNDLGMVVGTVFGANGFTGYLLSGGVYSAIAVPGAGNTSPLGINDSGDVVGITSTKGVASGFLLSGGDYSLIKVPGAASTFAFGINGLGTIVGSSQVGDVRTGYVLSDGVFTTVRVPGAVSTEVYGINDSGMIVGAYYGDDGIAHAYLGKPVPEPSSALLAGVAFPLILAWARRRRPGRCVKRGSAASPQLDVPDFGLGCCGRNPEVRGAEQTDSRQGGRLKARSRRHRVGSREKKAGRRQLYEIGPFHTSDSPGSRRLLIY